MRMMQDMTAGKRGKIIRRAFWVSCGLLLGCVGFFSIGRIRRPNVGTASSTLLKDISSEDLLKELKIRGEHVKGIQEVQTSTTSVTERSPMDTHVLSEEHRHNGNRGSTARASQILQTSTTFGVEMSPTSTRLSRQDSEQDMTTHGSTTTTTPTLQSSTTSAVETPKTTTQLEMAFTTQTKLAYDREACWKHSSSCASSIDWHELHPKGLADVHSPEYVLDMEVVAIGRGAATFRGLNQTQLMRLKSSPVEPYYFWVESNPMFRFSHRHDASADSWDLGNDCAQRVDGTSLLLPPHHPDNAHHLHKDLISKVAFLLVHFKLQPTQTRLYLLRGWEARFRQHGLLLHTLDAVLGKVVYPFEEIAHSEQLICHRRFLWTPTWSWRADNRCLWAGYEYTVGRWGYQNWRPVMGQWVQWTTNALGLAEFYDVNKASIRCTSILKGGEKPILLWLARSMGGNPRAVVNVQEVLANMRNSFHLSVLGMQKSDFADEHWPRARFQLKQVIRQIASADVLAGYFGSGIVNALYMRPGGLIVVLQGTPWFAQRIFINLAALRRLSFYISDVRRHMVHHMGQRSSVSLPSDYVDGLRHSILDRVNDECLKGDAKSLLPEKIDTVKDYHDVPFPEQGWDTEEPRCKVGESLQWAEVALQDSRLSAFSQARCYLVRTRDGLWRQEGFHSIDVTGPVAAAIYRHAKTLTTRPASLPTTPVQMCLWIAGQGWIHTGTELPVLLHRLVAPKHVRGSWAALAVTLGVWYFGRNLAMRLKLHHYVITDSEVPEIIRALPMYVSHPEFGTPAHDMQHAIRNEALCSCEGQLGVALPLGCPSDKTAFYSSLWQYAQQRDTGRVELPTPEEYGFQSRLRVAISSHLGFVGPSFSIPELHLPPRGLVAYFGCPSDGQADIIPASTYGMAAAGMTDAEILVATPASEDPDEHCKGILKGLTRALRKRVQVSRVRRDISPSNALATLALSKRVLCAPEDPSRAFCFFAALGGFQGIIATSTRFFPQRPPLPAHMSWTQNSQTLLAEVAARMQPPDVLAWIMQH